MALVIEDGTLVAGANSFVTRSEIIAYAESRGIVIPDEDASDVHAINAMDYMTVQCLRGKPVNATQLTPFPRMGLVAGDTAVDYEYSIPDNVKRAQMQLALDSFNGIELVASGKPEAVVKRRKVGPIEREFFAPGEVGGGQANAPQLTLANALLAPWLCGQGFTLHSMRA